MRVIPPACAALASSSALFTVLCLVPTSAFAIATRTLFSPTGTVASERFGISVAPAGDMNGDGFDDVIVGAPDGVTGHAYVYLGGLTPDATADLTLIGGADEFGFAVASAGDVNGDGFDDVIVGAFIAGRAYIYLGGVTLDSVADVTLIGTAAEQFGFSVASAGDINRDGFSDVIVGAPSNDAAGFDAGRAYVYFGGRPPDAVADLALFVATTNAEFGYSVASAGDVNGDGFDDVIVGAPKNDAGGADAGAFYIYRGGNVPDATADLIVSGDAGTNYGLSVNAAGDVNGDGFDDFVVGAPLHDIGGSDAGRIYIYFGPSAATSVIVTGARPTDRLGVSVASAGDVNGDGFADVIVSSDTNDDAGVDVGRAYVFYGGTTPNGLSDLVLTGVATGDQFGRSVAPAGDVTGDGFDDLVVGAFRNDAGAFDAGAAYVFDINRYHLVSPIGGETWNVGATRVISWLGAEPADVSLSVDGGATYTLLETGVGGDPFNSLAVRVPHLPTRFARVQVEPTGTVLPGRDRSDSLFTIQTSVSLLAFTAQPRDAGAELTWSTDPGVGPEGLLGYRLYRLPPGAGGGGTRIGPELIVTSRYVDGDAVPGAAYRLIAVNGLGEELELGRATLAMPVPGIQMWPSPVTSGRTVWIDFVLPIVPGLRAADFDVGVFDVRGRRVVTLSRGPMPVQDGRVSLEWKVSGRDGGSLAPGIYFLRVVAPLGGFDLERKIVVVAS